MAQVVSSRPLTAEARVRARVNPCGICGGQSVTGTGFSPSSSVFPCQYHSTVALQTHIIWGMRNMLTSVGIHAWVLDPPHLQGKTNWVLSFSVDATVNVQLNCHSAIPPAYADTALSSVAILLFMVLPLDSIIESECTYM
jgi:hypothetical protein